MRTRQFKTLAGMSLKKRGPLLEEGLEAIAANVAGLTEELESCEKVDARRAAQLLVQVAREEAGKFLCLMDVCRSPRSSQAVIARQFHRAGDHLSKLIYAQLADYSLADQRELVSAVDRHRLERHLDGPMDFDWIFANELLTERESTLYVDLVDSEGEMWWTKPDTPFWVPHVERPLLLVLGIAYTGLATVAGFTALRNAWADFDQTCQSTWSDWKRRTHEALQALPEPHDKDWENWARLVADYWPMPIVEIETAKVPVSVEQLAAQRERLYDQFLEREYGPFE